MALIGNWLRYRVGSEISGRVGENITNLDVDSCFMYAVAKPKLCTFLHTDWVKWKLQPWTVAPSDLSCVMAASL